MRSRTRPALAVLTAVGLTVPGVLLTSPAAPAVGLPRQSRATSTSAPTDRPGWQARYEDAFREEVTPAHPAAWMTRLAADSAHVGTPGSRRNLDYSVARLREVGLHVRADSYSVLATRPRSIEVTQIGPDGRTLRVIEDRNDIAPADLPIGYNAYSPSGTVSGDVVYVNYARPEDFAELARRGVSLKGKIALARYGKNFRGVKPDQAAKAGAVGMIIYSDPADDGYTKGKTYPDGPWRSPDALQRGSVLRLWQYPGDPETPGRPSTPGARRDPRGAARTFAPIPTTPISYGQARSLLAGLRGPEVGAGWKGGLDVPYRFGPGGTRVRLALDIPRTHVPVRNVVATVPGTDRHAGYVLVGAHRDTWAHGAVDNTSGWVSTMEIGRALGALYREGWRPRRTIVLAGWDGEEYGLLGSTEYAENDAACLRRRAVAYINMDGTAGRAFGAGSVPSLDEVIRFVTAQVDDPGGTGTVLQSWTGKSGASPTPGRLGSGSDYTAFLQHLGVPSVDIGFSSPGGQYHAMYDDLDYVRRFADPGFTGTTAAAEVSGSLALRLANADVLPIRHSATATETLALLNGLRATAPAGSDIEPAVRAARAWRTAAERLEAEGLRLAEGGVTPRERHRADRINAALMTQERALLTPRGLPGRPWFAHQLWAPGRTTGYAVQPLPALAEAAEAKDARAFDAAVADLTRSLRRAAKDAHSALR